MLPVLSCIAMQEKLLRADLGLRLRFAVLVLSRMNQFLHDVLTGHQLSRYATSKLFHCEACDELLVCCGPLRACSGEETEEPIDQGAYLGLESDDIQQVEEAP